MPVSTREDKGFAAGGLRAATESFPPIAPVLISAETLHSPAHSKRKPKRSPHKTADLSNNVDANDAQVAQTSPILEGEEDGITRTQLAALIAELGAENSLRREDVDRDTFGTAWTRLAGTEFERSLTGNDSSSEILLQPADSFADTGSDFRIRKDAPPAFRSTTISVRLSESEFSLVRQRASAAGVSPAAYLRVCVLVEREPRAEINEALAAMRHAAIELQAAGSRKSLDWNLRQPPYKTPWFQKIRRFFHARSKPVPTPDSKHSPIWRTNLGKIRSL